MSTKLAQSKLVRADIAKKQAELKQELHNIQMRKGQHITRETDLVEEFNNPELVESATKKYDNLAIEKADNYQAQLLAEKKAEKLQQSEEKLHQLEKEIADENIAELKQGLDESKESYDNLQAQVDAAKADGKELHPLYDNLLNTRKEKLAKLEAAEKSAEVASKAAQVEKAESAKKVKQACTTTKCKATTLTVYGDDSQRATKLICTGSKQKTLKVISLSKSGVIKKLESPPVEVITAYLDGVCEKGKLTSSPESGDVVIDARSDADSCPTLKVNDGFVNVNMPGTSGLPLKFQAYCTNPSRFALGSWKDLIANAFFPEKIKPETYVIETKGCDGSYPISARIEAYPKWKSELLFSMTYKEKSNSDDKSDKSDKKTTTTKNSKTTETDKWVFAAEVKGSIDSVSLGLQLEHLEPEDLFKGIREAIEPFVTFFSYAKKFSDIKSIVDGDDEGDDLFSDVYKKKEIEDSDLTCDVDKKDDKVFTMSIKYPKVALAIGYENCEVIENESLDYIRTVAIKADPLLGLDFKLDILKGLIKMGAEGLLPGSNQAISAGKKVAKYLKKAYKDHVPTKDAPAIKEKKEEKDKAFSGDISIELKASANLGLAAKWVKENSQLTRSAELDDAINSLPQGADASAEFSLEGKAFVKTEAFSITFEAGFMVMLGAENEIAASKITYSLNFAEQGEKLKVIGGFEWTGFAIKIICYKVASTKKKKNDNELITETSNKFATEESESSSETHDASETNLKTEKKKVRKQWVLIKSGKHPEAQEVPLEQYVEL